MELLYIWIEDYKNIKRQGFNFSAQYRFEFTDLQISKDENGKETVTGGTLNVTENPNYIEDFFGDNITNVTAIVGENGSGKSTLIDFIDIHFSNDVGHTIPFNNYFICLKTPNESKIFMNYNNKNFNISYNKDKIIASNYGIFNGIHLSHQYPTPYIYYSTDFINKGELHSKLGIDISNAYYINLFNNELIENLPLDELPDEDFKTWFLNKNFVEQIAFLSKFNGLFIINLFITIELKSYADPDYIYSSFYEKINKQIQSNILISICERLFILIYYGFKDKKEVLKKWLQNEQIVFKNHKELVISFYKLFNNETKNVEMFFYLLEKLEVTSMKAYDIGDFGINFTEVVKKKRIEDIYKFTNCCKKLGKELGQDFCKCFWDLSSGEFNLLNLFSRLNQANLRIPKFADGINVKETEIKNCIILIDEGEIGLHLQWQKKYLQNLIDLLPKIFKEKHLQFILTSHSPFLVSDLPKDHVIFLEKGEDGTCKVKDSLNEMKQTFGANIHTLLTDSFFMKGGLMGEFAKEKIQHLINYINRENLDKCKIKTDEQAQKYLNIIGEPIIKNFLQKQLDSRRLERVEKDHDARIKYLEEELERLKTKKQE